MLLLPVVIYIALGLYEFIPLYKQKQKKDFLVNAVLFCLSFAAAILLCLGIKIPTPSAPIREMITSIFGK